MQVQLALMYGTDKERLHIVMPIIIQQRNIFDCGVFAITNAVEFCFTNFDGIEVRFRPGQSAFTLHNLVTGM